MANHFAHAGVSLCDLLDDAQVVGGQPELATCCTSDWRQVQPGDVFVALVDDRCDGHDHGGDAVQRGAAAVVCERPLPVFDVPQLVVDDSRTAYGKICQALVGNPCEKMKVVGITGTSGKSCVAALLASVLETAGARTGVLGSLGYDDGYDHVAAFQTTPSPPLMAEWLGRMVAGSCTHAVVELSSEGLAQSRVAGLELDAVCVTSVGRDHLDRHGSQENYRRAKRRIFEQLQPHGVAVLNADDTHCCRTLATLDHPVLTFGIDKPAEVTAILVERFVGEQTFLLMAGTDSAAVRTPIVGTHHIRNCLAAATVGLAYGIDLPTVARGLEAVQRIPGRMDRVAFGQGYGLWVDAADSPHQLAAMLEAVRGVASGRVICSLLPRAAYAPGQRRQLYLAARRLADISIITDGRHGATNAHETADYTDAIAWALRQARRGDSVLVAASPDAPVGQFHTDDPELVKQWLREVAMATETTKAAA